MRRARARAPYALIALQALIGGSLLDALRGAPRAPWRLRGGRAERAIAAALGARHLAEGALLLERPDARRLRACVAVDLTHALTMVALAARSPSLRALALKSLALALCCAALEARVAAR